MNKQFEEWLDDQKLSPFGFDIDASNISKFYTLPFSMKWGVYLEFFDSVGVKIHLYFRHQNGWDYKISYRNERTMNPYRTFDAKYSSGGYVLKPETAQQAAIKKAFEILTND